MNLALVERINKIALCCIIRHVFEIHFLAGEAKPLVYTWQCILCMIVKLAYYVKVLLTQQLSNIFLRNWRVYIITLLYNQVTIPPLLVQKQCVSYWRMKGVSQVTTSITTGTCSAVIQTKFQGKMLTAMSFMFLQLILLLNPEVLL